MTYCSQFIESDAQASFFLKQFFNFLAQFDRCDDETIPYIKKERTITQSFILIKHLMFYYDARDLLIEQLNVPEQIIFCDKKRFSILFKQIYDVKNLQFKSLHELFNNYFEKIFSTSKNVYICTKDSQPSVLWKNEENQQIFFVV